MAVAAAFVSGQTASNKQTVPLKNMAIISQTLPRAGALCQQDQRKTEGNVFRYDFIELPPVDRNLKPKKSFEELRQTSPHQTKPQVDRKLKPSIAARANSISVMDTRTLPKYINPIINGDENTPRPGTQQHKLQYIELDIPSSSAAGPQNPKVANRASLISLVSNHHHIHNNNSNINNNNSNNMNNNINNISNPGLRHQRSASMSSQKSVDSAMVGGSGVVYNYVDFVKTDAFKRILEERKKEGSK